MNREDAVVAESGSDDAGTPGSWNLGAAGALAVCGLVSARGNRRRSA